MQKRIDTALNMTFEMATAFLIWGLIMFVVWGASQMNRQSLPIDLIMDKCGERPIYLITEGVYTSYDHIKPYDPQKLFNVDIDMCIIWAEPLSAIQSFAQNQFATRNPQYGHISESPTIYYALVDKSWTP